MKSTVIISILNQKGGVGKTTIATNLAKAFHIENVHTILVDADPQGSARDWRDSCQLESTVPVVAMDRESLDKDIYALEGYDIIVIDTPPEKYSKISVAAVRCSDLVIIPVQPSQYDIWACDAVVEIIKTRQEMTQGKPKALFLLSMVLKNTKLEKEVKEVLREYSIPQLANYTTRRVVYPTTSKDGKTVFDSDDKKAIEEMKGIKEEIEKWL